MKDKNTKPCKHCNDTKMMVVMIGESAGLVPCPYCKTDPSQNQESAGSKNKIK